MEGCGEGLVVACSGDPPMLELELLVERLPSELKAIYMKVFVQYKWQ